MSEALQQAAGERLRRALAALTRTPLTGALAGMVVTAVVQSSSATTVMVIGFVSAGLLELPQAVAVIFGANIGTTVTAQLLAFRVFRWILRMAQCPLIPPVPAFPSPNLRQAGRKYPVLRCFHG